MLVIVFSLILILFRRPFVTVVDHRASRAVLPAGGGVRLLPPDSGLLACRAAAPRPTQRLVRGQEPPESGLHRHDSLHSSYCLRSVEVLSVGFSGAWLLCFVLNIFYSETPRNN